METDGGRVYCGASRQRLLSRVLLLWGLTANRADPVSSTPIPIAIQPLRFLYPMGLGLDLGWTPVKAEQANHRKPASD